MRLFLSLAVLAVAAQAALLPVTEPAMMRPALYKRQLTTSPLPFTYRTLGFYSVATNAEGFINWSSRTYLEWEDNTASYPLHFTTTDSFYSLCMLPSVTSQSYYWPDSASSCTIWTTCSMGTLWAASSASLFCNNGFSLCYTDYLYDSWGATDRRTNLYCGISSTIYSTVTSYYEDMPPATVPASSLPATNSASTTTGTVATQPTSPIPSNTSTGAPAPTTNNTKIIAGAAVGGIVGLAFAAVGALLIVKHYRYRAKPQAPGTFTQAAYYEDKPPGLGDVPEWVPTPPATSPTPNKMIRNDGYHPDSIRNGTPGARSPIH